jgi:hypothetical protein
MLKIKDNVDLKELEKFGFKKEEDHDIIYYLKENIYDNNMEYADFKVEDHNRIIKMNLFKKDKMNYPLFDVNQDDTIFDLIQSGLVEKVEE